MRNAGQEGCRTGGRSDAGPERMQDMLDVGQERCRTKGCRTGRMNSRTGDMQD